MATSYETLIKALLTNTFTVMTAQRRIALLRQAIEAVLYQDNAADKTELYRTRLASIATDVETQAILHWGVDWVTELTIESWRTLERQLEEWVASVPQLTLYVPVVFDADGEALVGEWCREQYQPDLLLDLQVDPNTVGGCALVRDGHYHDLSLAAKLDEQPKLVPAILQSYDR